MQGKESSQVQQRSRNGSARNSSYNQSNSLLNDISSVLLILKLTGLLPFHRMVSSYELGPPTRLHCAYLIVAHVLFHLMTVYNIFNFLTKDTTKVFNSHRDTDSVNYWIEIVLCIVTYTTTVFVCLKNSKLSIKIMKDILKVDEEIKRHFFADISNNCGFASKFILLILILEWYIMTLEVMDTDESLTVSSYFLIGFYSIQNGMSSIFVVYTSLLLRIVAVRFEYMNSVINGFSYREQQRDFKSRNRYLHAASPRKNFSDDSLFVFRTHNKLLRLYKAINEACSITLVVYMGYAFYSITTTTYSLFVQITKQRDMSAIAIQISFVVLFAHTIMLGLLSRCAGQATDQANKTSSLLARVYGKTKEYQIIIDKFLTKSIKQEVQFTAYGFFVIDNATLFKIFSAVTTYLVILIQFKQLEESKMDGNEGNVA